MTRAELLAAIRSVATQRLQVAASARIDEQTRFEDDLRFDSLRMMNLFLYLETEQGVQLTDEAIGASALARVGDLIDLLAASDAVPVAADHVADPGSFADSGYVDIKVHCVVSCLSALIKAAGLDHRPYYFGLWDEGFAVDDQGALRYHHPDVSHAHLFDAAARLYGLRARQWYDFQRGKDENMRRLTRLVESPADGRTVMAMIDLFHLPERENRFNQDPFPHYVLLRRTDDPDIWFMEDPDFRWEGPMARDAILNAAAQASVAGGFLLDPGAIHEPADADTAEYFLARLRSDNPLTGAVILCIDRVAAAADPAPLETRLAEMPLLIIRKYAYEHAFAYFWRDLGRSHDSFLAHCDRIEALAAGLRQSHFEAVRFARTGDRAALPVLRSRLDALDALERRIKSDLRETFQDWRAKHGSALVPA
ncbi:acyl carrier protein [Paracoccus halophilus]|uniref:Acyl carrier protein n=1 Tax=Paracoccus halophilus TaxID=376733 RepID=A0A099EXT6_9RHOB|nr:DUF6005 family protein [Paracoccus halophilus]KGJ02788.1 hypothetical protein IT41_16365 [Paracoccus halophilus]SFA60002.1 acyl carrier protein [Paracoccus halophilus]